LKTDKSMLKLRVQIATIGPVGRLPVAPGTWGSALAVIIWWLFLANLAILQFWLIIIMVLIIAVWASHGAEHLLGSDARSIIIDEVVGQWIALAFCSTHIMLVVSAFFIFRLFDIWKPFPIKQSQNIRGGLGVVIDDVLAGAYSALVLVIIQRVWIG